MKNHSEGSFPPWSRIESLKEMAEEIGIDYKNLLTMLKDNQDSKTIAEALGISITATEALTKHFYSYGVSSVIGGD